MSNSPPVFGPDRDSSDAECETVCESVRGSGAEANAAATETLAVRRDARSGRFERRSATVSRDEARALGADTRFAPGTQAGRRHGVRAFQVRGEAALDADQRTALEAFRGGVEADQGGASELTTIGAGYVRRLCEMEVICDLLAVDLATRGMFTQRGRVRSTYGAFLQAVDRWDRLAQRLGTARRERRVPSLAEYLANRPSETDDDGPEEPGQDVSGTEPDRGHSGDDT